MTAAFGGSRQGAIEAEKEIFLALADQPADTDDLAGAGLEIEVVDHAGPGSP